jgi:alpha-beta hydrolase superfamily lysophospholipase
MAVGAALAGTGLLEALRAGEALRLGDDPPSPDEIERALGPATEAVRGSLERHGGLQPAGLDAALAGLRHEFVEYRGARVHLEVHEAGEGRPTIAVHHGLGDHVRRMTPLAARFAAEGFNVVMLDRPGHGVSEGRRGHCPLDWALELVDQSVSFAREQFGGPVVLLGDSLGGITLWYALTRDLDAEAVVCHCIAHPGVRHDRSMLVKAPLMKATALISPYAPVPVTRIADYGHVALDPVTKDYFDRRADPAFCFTASMAMAASYLEFTPGRPWESVRTPVLVTIGAADRMTTPSVTRESFDRATPPRAEYLEMRGVGHQMFLDHLQASFPPLVEWVRGRLVSI